MPEKIAFVKDLVPGQPVADVFLLSEAKSGQAKNGPYWSLVLEDASGAVEAKIWSPQSLAHESLAPGSFVLASGMVGSYRDKTQITVDRLEILSEEAFVPDLSQFLASSARKPEDLLADLTALCRERLTHKPWRRLCLKVLADPEVKARLLASPGAKGIHHAYVGGLLEHTLAVCRICDAFCDLYPALDRDTLLAAALFHDLGKAWELTQGLTRDYTDPGRLLGHIVLSLEILAPFLKKASDLDPALVLHFKHLVVSHHGEYEFGSPKRPKTPEAFVLHFADNADAKLNTIFGFFPDDEADEAPAWSPFVRSLDRYVHNPRRVPRDPLEADAATASPDKTKTKGADQCSLPLKA